ncbi:hypothetical protein DFH06DRAFT_1293976 [Mycena polygramma]|nr:hypothetical protein DFH06DRAFT_1293976 [Mycena polygramma]
MDATLMPALPSDLEYLIFEVAALLWPRSIPKFMLVAWRVKIWLEPLLYRTIIVLDEPSELEECNKVGTHPLAIESSVFVSVLRTKPPSFFGNSVRQLHLGTTCLDKTDEADVLSACSNVENLWLAARSQVTVAALNMPLKRIHCTLDALFGNGAIDFTHRMFASIAHLEIFNAPAAIDVEVWSALASVPHLTHLAFNDDDYLPMCLILLRTWTSLRVLAFLLSRVDLAKAPKLVEDRRFVVMPCEEFLADWIMGAYTGNDYWSRAEDFVAKRKSGEIDPLKYYIDSV